MTLKIFIIFIIALVLDGLILPALFGFRNSFLSMLVLITPILYMGPTKQCLVCGLFFSATLELFRGLDLGTLAVPFLSAAAVLYVAQKFLDIKYTYDTRFGFSKLVLLALTSTVSIYLISLFYNRGHIIAEIFHPGMALNILSEALILVFVFNIIFNKKSYY